MHLAQGSGLGPRPQFVAMKSEHERALATALGSHDGRADDEAGKSDGLSRRDSVPSEPRARSGRAWQGERETTYVGQLHILFYLKLQFMIGYIANNWIHC